MTGPIGLKLLGQVNNLPVIGGIHIHLNQGELLIIILYPIQVTVVVPKSNVHVCIAIGVLMLAFRLIA